MMNLSIKSFAVFVSLLASVRSHQTPTSNNGIIDASFDIDLFSSFSGKKFEFKSLFDIDAGVMEDNTQMIIISSNDADGDRNSTFDNDQEFASPSTLLLLRDHATIDQRLNPNTLPCRFYTRDGGKINDLNQLKSMYINGRRRLSSSLSNTCTLHHSPDDTACSENGVVNHGVDEYEELHVYAVPSGSLFIYTPSFYAKCSKSHR